jgi:Flp pilus assembly protein TadD
MLLARQRRYLDAYLQLRPWALENPDDLQARQVAAFCAVQLERPTEAEELLSELPQDEPTVRLLWGKVLLLKADPWGALATLKPLLENAPPDMELDVRRSIAECYAAVGESASAVEVLREHVGESASVALQLGQAQYQSGDLEGALATMTPFAQALLARAGAGNPPQRGTYELSLIVEEGRLLVTSGRHEEAIPYLELATRLDPDNKQSWHQLGQALAASGRRDEARAALERFQEIVQNEVPGSLRDVQLDKDLDDPTGRQLREAMKALAKGEVEAAIEIARQEKVLSPGDPRPWLVEGRALMEAGRLAEALEVANAVVEGAPELADPVYLRGTIFMGLDQMDDAERDLRKALELAPDHTAAMNDLAVLLMGRGQNAEAKNLLERALALRPEDTLAAENLKRLNGGA